MKRIGKTWWDTWGGLQPHPASGSPSAPNGQGASRPGTPWSPLLPLSPFLPRFPGGPCIHTRETFQHRNGVLMYRRNYFRGRAKKGQAQDKKISLCIIINRLKLCKWASTVQDKGVVYICCLFIDLYRRALEQKKRGYCLNVIVRYAHF